MSKGTNSLVITGPANITNYTLLLISPVCDSYLSFVSLKFDSDITVPTNRFRIFGVYPDILEY